MITNRRIVQVKQGRLEEFAALILVEAKHAKPKHGFRIYTTNIGPNNTFVLEIDFDDLAEYERFWRDWVCSMPLDTFNEKYAALIERDIAYEIWNRKEVDMLKPQGEK